MKVSIVTPVYNTPEKYLRECIQSVLDQSDPNWELLLVDDGSTEPHIPTLLEEAAETDPRIKIDTVTHRGIAEATNRAVEMASGEYCAFLDSDDLLGTDLIKCVIETSQEAPDMIYTDKDHVSPDGQHYNRFWKPDWHPFRVLGGNFVVHCMIFRTELISQVGWVRIEYETTQDYDLVLRVADVAQKVSHIPLPLYSWRLFPGTTSQNAEHYNVAVSCLTDTLRRRNLTGYARKGVPGLFITTFIHEGRILEIAGHLVSARQGTEQGSTFLTKITERSDEGERETWI